MVVSELTYFPGGEQPRFTCVCCHAEEEGPHWDARDGRWHGADGVCASCFDDFVDEVRFPLVETLLDAVTWRLWKLTRGLFDGVTWLHDWVQGRHMAFLQRTLRLYVAVSLDDEARARRRLLRAYAESVQRTHGIDDGLFRLAQDVEGMPLGKGDVVEGIGYWQGNPARDVERLQLLARFQQLAAEMTFSDDPL